MRVLWIALVWPEPESSAAGLRTTQLLKTLLDGGYEVQVSSPAKPNEHRSKLEALGVSTVHYPPNDSSFDLYLTQYQPELVFFDRFMAEEQFGWRVREQLPEAIRVLDTIDLHSLRRARKRAVSEGRNPLELQPKDLLSTDSVRELAAIYRSDLSLIISQAECKILTDYFAVPESLISYLPLSYLKLEAVNGFQVRRNFVTIGNFNHEPNSDSFNVLREGLWEKIRSAVTLRGEQTPELHIYGAYPTKEFMDYDNPATGFRVKGWAEDSLQTLSNYRVNLAPLRFGAGIKGKVSDGWAVGTPCVGTTIAAEGMGDSSTFGGFIEDDWDSFSRRAAEIYSDAEVFNEAQRKALATVGARFDRERNRSKFLAEIESAVLNTESKRLKNFVGEMLWYNQNRSSEYFSRWIEAKNRLKDSQG